MLKFLHAPRKYTSNLVSSVKAAAQGHLNWKSEKGNRHWNLLPICLLRSQLQQS